MLNIVYGESMFVKRGILMQWRHMGVVESHIIDISPVN